MCSTSSEDATSIRLRIERADTIDLYLQALAHIEYLDEKQGAWSCKSHLRTHSIK